jgi:hypothetical protein
MKLAFNPSDITAIAAYIAGGGLAGVFSFAALLAPHIAAPIGGAAVALVSLAGLVRVVFNRNGAPATSVVVNAPVVAASVEPTTPTTPAIGVNAHNLNSQLGS